MVAEQLKKEEGFDITVIDSGMFAMAIGYPVIEAAKLAEKGASLSEVIDFLNESFKRNTAYFVIDDLTFLKKGRKNQGNHYGDKFAARYKTNSYDKRWTC